MSARNNGFDPNQKRASDGTWEKQSGTRPRSGTLQPRSQPLPTPGEAFYHHQDARDKALDRSTWDDPDSTYIPTDAIINAGRANERMVELAPVRIGELMAEVHPDATAAMFKNVDGRLQFTGFATEHTLRPVHHPEPDEGFASEINELMGAIDSPYTRWSEHDISGMRLDKAGNWYLPLRAAQGDEQEPGWARESPDGVAIELAGLEYQARQLQNRARDMDRPTTPIPEITDQAELMWFVESGSQEELLEVTKSRHVGPAVLNDIARYRSENARQGALMSWGVSTATIRDAWASTPKTTPANINSGILNSGKTPPDVREEAKSLKSPRQRPAPQPKPAPTPAAPVSRGHFEDLDEEPSHWARYTPEEREELRARVPINFDELGSSAKDLWEERVLASFARAKKRAAQDG